MFNDSCSIFNLIENAIHALLFPFSGQMNRAMNDKIILILTTKYQLKKKKLEIFALNLNFNLRICSLIEPHHNISVNS